MNKTKNSNNKIIIKTPQGEMDLEYLCEKQYEKINGLMHLIENEFDTSLHEHEKLRHEILDISNFIKRLPSMVSEVIKNEY